MASDLQATKSDLEIQIPYPVDGRRWKLALPAWRQDAAHARAKGFLAVLQPYGVGTAAECRRPLYRAADSNGPCPI